MLACVMPAMAQVDLVSNWRKTSRPIVPAESQTTEYLAKYQVFNTDFKQLEAELHSIPVQSTGPITTGRIFSMPNPNGTISRFKIAESPIMTEELQRQTTSRTYRVQGIDDPYATGRLDIGVNGFHAYVTTPNGSYIIDPIKRSNLNEYVVYFRKDNLTPRNFTCYTETAEKSRLDPSNFVQAFAFGTLKTYRLAMNATVEYTNYYGGVTNATAAVVTTINRVNQVYERDLAIRMILVRNNCYSGAANSDPYSNNNGVAMLSQNQTVCDSTVGNANYDIGHVFSTGGGGVAGLKVVGVTGQKAQGVTGSPAPIGDPFDIDYVAHEMGHQYGANHTFNSTLSSCGGGNRSASHAYEPGSGSTIMGYAGICSSENIQPNSDDYMHWDSIINIWAWRNNSSSGGSEVSNGNTPPTAEAGPNYTIPQGTPYKLTGSGTDANGDALTYCWEQADLGSSTTSPTQYSTGPLVRSLKPTTSPVRFIPKLQTVINNTTDNWEKLPNTNRNLNYRLTVRDNRSGGGNYAMDTMTITVSGSPFQVTAPNTNVTLSGGSTTTVTWNVGGGSVASNVRILLSTNGGLSYGDGTATVLVASTPNDGSEVVTLPNINSTTCRIIVEAVGNIFYDMSNTNFTITASSNPAPVLTSISPASKEALSGAFTLTVNGSNFVNGSVVRWNGSNLTTTYVNSTQLTATVPAANLNNVGSFPITVFTPAPGGGTSSAVNFQVTPITVAPTAAAWTIGVADTGSLADILASDNSYMKAKVSLATSSTPRSFRQALEVTGSTVATSASALTANIEVGVSDTPVSCTLQAWDYTTSSWVSIQMFGIFDTADTVKSINIPTPSKYLAGGQLKLRIGFDKHNLAASRMNYAPRVDFVSWTLTP